MEKSVSLSFCWTPSVNLLECYEGGIYLKNNWPSHKAIQWRQGFLKRKRTPSVVSFYKLNF
jgi:hypothetical protein